MFATYLVVTLLTAAVSGGAALANLLGHAYPRTQADMLGVPRSWIPVLGTVLAAGSAGLLAGFAVPLLGALAAGGLVLYFAGAFVAHLRAGDRRFGLWSVFFGLSAGALVLNLAYHGLG